jgi:hypothetical protein
MPEKLGHTLAVGLGATAVAAVLMVCVWALIALYGALF